MGAQVENSLKMNKRVSRAEQEAEKYLGKIVVILSETQPIELSFLARMLYLSPDKLRYWLVKKRLWNDFIMVEKRNGKWWVSFGGPKRAWLAAVYDVNFYYYVKDELKSILDSENGNELFKRMIEIGSRGNFALFAHELEDGRILLLYFNGKSRKFLACIPLRTNDVLVNGEYAYNTDNPEVRRMMEKILGLLGFKSVLREEREKIVLQPGGLMWLWTFITLIVVKMERGMLDKALKEGVIEVSGVYQE